MVKVSSRDILDILRRFELANNNNIPRNVEMVKRSHPSPINILVSFIFLKNKYYLLFDDTADEDEKYIIDQIESKKGTLSGELINNPRDHNLTYALPYKGKTCYLFAILSEKKRLDSEVTKRYPENSRSTWQKYIREGYVSVNGDIVMSPKHEISDSDKITVNIPKKQDFSNNEIPIIYIDDNVIIVNKPSGILSHSKGVLNDEFTIADFFKRYTTYNIDSNRPGIIHRLDRDTSGVMIGARNSETASLLQKQFTNRTVNKTYIAVLKGVPKLKKAIIDLPIERNPSRQSTFKVGSNGKSAITKYEVIDSNDKYSLVKLQPKTGRTHQLRVHMKYLNCPILGDKTYGNPSDRLYLHAYRLEVAIPDGKYSTYIAPIPDVFDNIFPGVKL